MSDHDEAVLVREHISEIEARVRPTICPTLGMREGELKETREGRILSSDFHALWKYALRSTHDAAHGGWRPIAGCNGLDTPDRVRFYEHDFYVLSNFSAFRLNWCGLDYDTSEHAYQSARFHIYEPNGAACRAKIMATRSAHEAFKIAQDNKRYQLDDWNERKVEVMHAILTAKAEQHEYVRRKLLATGDRELVEDSWRDDYWGWGPNQGGQNMLGRLWMQIRAELRHAAPPSPKSGG